MLLVLFSSFAIQIKNQTLLSCCALFIFFFNNFLMKKIILKTNAYLLATLSSAPPPLALLLAAASAVAAPWAELAALATTSVALANLFGEPHLCAPNQSPTQAAKKSGR